MKPPAGTLIRWLVAGKRRAVCGYWSESVWYTLGDGASEADAIAAAWANPFRDRATEAQAPKLIAASKAVQLKLFG